jgi:hypothetical protein
LFLESSPSFRSSWLAAHHNPPRNTENKPQHERKREVERAGLRGGRGERLDVGGCAEVEGWWGGGAVGHVFYINGEKWLVLYQ